MILDQREPSQRVRYVVRPLTGMPVNHAVAHEREIINQIIVNIMTQKFL